MQGLRVASETGLATCRRELTRLDAEQAALAAAVTDAQRTLAAAERVAGQATAAARATREAEAAANAVWTQRLDALERARQQTAALR